MNMNTNMNWQDFEQKTRQIAKRALRNPTPFRSYQRVPTLTTAHRQSLQSSARRARSICSREPLDVSSKPHRHYFDPRLTTLSLPRGRWSAPVCSSDNQRPSDQSKYLCPRLRRVQSVTANSASSSSVSHLRTLQSTAIEIDQYGHATENSLWFIWSINFITKNLSKTALGFNKPIGISKSIQILFCKICKCMFNVEVCWKTALRTGPHE